MRSLDEIRAMNTAAIEQTTMDAKQRMLELFTDNDLHIELERRRTADETT